MFIKNKKGNTLVISILLMTVMLAITVGLSNAFVTELRLSSNLDDALLAYYGAESGIEYGLYDARKTDLTLAGSVDTDTFSNGVEWVRTTDDQVDALALTEISHDESIQLDFFDPDDPAVASGVGSLVVDWDGASGSWALVKLTSWVPATTIDWSTKTDEEFLQANSAASFIINTDSTRAYKFKIKALHQNLNNVNIIAYDGLDATGNPVEIPNFLDITGEGVYRDSHQAISVSMPRGIPLASLYNYVIFTEESLIKELSN